LRFTKDGKGLTPHPVHKSLKGLPLYFLYLHCGRFHKAAELHTADFDRFQMGYGMGQNTVRQQALLDILLETYFSKSYSMPRFYKNSIEDLD
jgi:hypothetical protein